MKLFLAERSIAKGKPFPGCSLSLINVIFSELPTEVKIQMYIEGMSSFRAQSMVCFVIFIAKIIELNIIARFPFEAPMQR